MAGKIAERCRMARIWRCFAFCPRSDRKCLLSGGMKGCCVLDRRPGVFSVHSSEVFLLVVVTSLLRDRGQCAVRHHI